MRHSSPKRKKQVRENEYANRALRICDFIQATLSAAGYSKVVVNLSGGIDSAVTAALALQVVGMPNLFLAMMPYGELGTTGVHHARLLVEALKIPNEQCVLLDIKRP